MTKAPMRVGRGSRGLGFLLLLAVVLYILVSSAVAVTTIKDCDPNGNGPKHWSFVPPHWVCEHPQNISPN